MIFSKKSILFSSSKQNSFLYHSIGSVLFKVIDLSPSKFRTTAICDLLFLFYEICSRKMPLDTGLLMVFTQSDFQRESMGMILNVLSSTRLLSYRETTQVQFASINKTVDTRTLWKITQRNHLYPNHNSPISSKSKHNQQESILYAKPQRLHTKPR